jgi:hypothetical protein
VSLENIYYIGQTVAVVAILATLIFVAVQVGQNTRAQRASALSSFNQLKFAHLSLLIENRDVATLHRAGLKDISNLDEIDGWRFGALMQQLFDLQLEAFRNPESFEGDDYIYRAASAMTRPGAIAWWRTAQALYPTAFQTVVERRIKALQAEREAGATEAE